MGEGEGGGFEIFQVTPTKHDFRFLKEFHHFLNVIAPSVIRGGGEGTLLYKVHVYRYV